MVYPKHTVAASEQRTDIMAIAYLGDLKLVHIGDLKLVWLGRSLVN